MAGFHPPSSCSRASSCLAFPWFAYRSQKVPHLQQSFLEVVSVSLRVLINVTNQICSVLCSFCAYYYQSHPGHWKPSNWFLQIVSLPSMSFSQGSHHDFSRTPSLSKHSRFKRQNSFPRLTRLRSPVLLPTSLVPSLPFLLAHAVEPNVQCSLLITSGPLYIVFILPELLFFN